MVEIDAAETYDSSREALKFDLTLYQRHQQIFLPKLSHQTPEYKLSLNDELKVILSVQTRHFSLKVQLDGSILFPELGSVFVQGETFAEAKKIKKFKAGNFQRSLI